MTETTIEDNAISKDDQWRDRIAEQERSGLSVKQFCKERGVSEYSFYTWRKRLAKREPVRFALVNREAAGQEPTTAMELVLMSGERLRIGNGVDAATLRTVVEALRA